ncbi:MAG: DMT family transporter [Vicinamibacterales bacterium]
MSHRRFGFLDVLLVLVVAAWGANLSVVKVAVRELPVHAFNGVRLLVAAVAFGLVLWRMAPGERRVARGDWGRVAALGLVGGVVYQLLFMTGVPLTSVANSGLIFGLSPVVISLLSSVVGHERLPVSRWAGGALSVLGLFLVVGDGASVSRTTLLGDGLVFLAMLCWAGYSVASRPMLGRYSATMLTAWAAIVTAPLYAVLVAPALVSVRWTDVSWLTWSLLLWSAVFSLAIAYVIWYTGVQQLGATRTSTYSNLTPLAAMFVGWWWLGEAVSSRQSAGAAAILGGVFLTRLSPVVLMPHVGPPAPPPE